MEKNGKMVVLGVTAPLVAFVALGGLTVLLAESPRSFAVAALAVLGLLSYVIVKAGKYWS